MECSQDFNLAVAFVAVNRDRILRDLNYAARDNNDTALKHLLDSLCIDWVNRVGSYDLLWEVKEHEFNTEEYRFKAVIKFSAKRFQTFPDEWAEVLFENPSTKLNKPVKVTLIDKGGVL